MTYNPVAIKRSYVLGSLYNQCDNIQSVPVYMDDASGDVLGYADESLGRYVDAFLFHLPEDICKKLSTGHYKYGFDFDFYQDEKAGRKKRIKLNYILLISRPAPVKAVKL